MTKVNKKQTQHSNNKRKKILLGTLIPIGVVVAAAAIIPTVYFCGSDANKQDISTIDVSTSVDREIGTINKGDNSDSTLTALFKAKNPALGIIDDWTGIEFSWSNKQFDSTPTSGSANLVINGGTSSKFKGNLTIGTIAYLNNRFDLSTESFQENIGNVYYDSHDSDDLTAAFKQTNSSMNFRDVNFAWTNDESWNANKGSRSLTLTAQASSPAYIGTKTISCSFEDTRVVPANLFTYDNSDHSIILGINGDISAYNTIVIPSKNPSDDTPITRIGISAQPSLFKDLPNNIKTFDTGDAIRDINGTDVFNGCAFEHFTFGKSIQTISSMDWATGKYNASGQITIPKCPIEDFTVRLGTSPSDATLVCVDAEGNIQNTGTTMTIRDAGMLVRWETVKGTNTTLLGYSVAFAFADVKIPSRYTTIGQRAFSTVDSRRCPIQHLSFKATNITISASAFTSCTIFNIDFTGVNKIGANAFKNVVGLTTINLTGANKVDGNNAFYGCGDVTEINLGSVEITSNGTGAFSSCPKVEKIIMNYDSWPASPAWGVPTTNQTQISGVFYNAGSSVDVSTTCTVENNGTAPIASIIYAFKNSYGLPNRFEAAP